ncbi:trans-aconitate 2-methyltransferase [Nostoc sp. FACHB-110]|uniref:class I SAM-dependent methyltransferase n=1 Tax=Nostoc sp. FACHB-110 TaxID=2692834 RepID=UPI0016893330|nr:class I SAM-dependent methyltransferase [Nostoc sp. FACHB-110]MBD2435875.1 class I SAM-dependent methyltransferase [Nostoc sp. FACHB-110]
MSSITRNTNHDTIASMYDLKGIERHDIVIDCLEKLILNQIPPEAHIFDLGCGTGQVAKRLLNRGYQVTGIDSSADMLNCARQNAPNAEFIVDDARYFQLPPTFHAAISTDGVLNYLLTLEELTNSLQNVYNALLTNGLFALEMYIEEGCESSWHENSDGGGVEENNVWVDIWSYDQENKVGRKATTRFQWLNGQWQRSDVTFLLKLYSKFEIQAALEKVGFREIKIYDLQQDLGLDNLISETACFVCRK